MLSHSLPHHDPLGHHPHADHSRPAASKPSARQPATRLAPPKAQQAAQAIAQVHVQAHAPQAHPAPPLAPAARTLVPYAPLSLAPGEMPADIRYTIDHHPGLTTAQRETAYGLWCLVTVARVALAAAAAAGGQVSEASPFLSLLSSAGSIYDAASGLGDKGIAKDKYRKAQEVHDQALDHWRGLARQVDAQPLDEASEQMLTACRQLVVLLRQVLDGYEAAYFPIAKANRLKAQRDLTLAAEDKWLALQRLAPTNDNAGQRAQLGQELQDLRQQIDALPQVSGIRRRDLERMQRQLGARAKRIRFQENLGPLLPDQQAQLQKLRQDQAAQKAELKRLKPFFTQSQGPTIFLNPDDLGTKLISEFRDAGINKLMQPLLLGYLAAYLPIHFLQEVPHIAAQFVGLFGSLFNVLGAGASMVYSFYDSTFSHRGNQTAKKADRKVLQDLGSAVELQHALVGVSDDHTIGRYLTENRIKSLLKVHKQHKTDKTYFFLRSWRSQLTFFKLAPLTLVLGGLGVGLYIAGNIATMGVLGAITAILAGASLAALLLAVTWRCHRAKRNKDEDKLKLRAMRHVQTVLGANGLHGLYTLSGPEFKRRMQPVLDSAPKGLRLELGRARLLKDNKFVAIEWLSRELQRGAQKAAREHGPVADSWARQMLLKLGMPEPDANYLQTCRPFCASDGHYLETCRKTIAAQLFNGTLYPDERLPHHQATSGLEASAQTLLDLLDPLNGAHKALSLQLGTAGAPEDFFPTAASHAQERQAQEERLARLRADLLQNGVGQKDLVELRKTVHDDDPMAWLLEALIDPGQRGQAPGPLKGPSQALVVQAPVLSYEMLDRCFKFIGRQNESKLVQYFKGNALTANPMGTARQFLEQQKHHPQRKDQVLDALAEWKRGELQKMDGQPTVPPGYPSMDAWLLAAMGSIVKQCDHCSDGLRIVDDKGQPRGTKLQRRFDDWRSAARLLEQHQWDKMRAAAAAA